MKKNHLTPARLIACVCAFSVASTLSQFGQAFAAEERTIDERIESAGDPKVGTPTGKQEGGELDQGEKRDAVTPDGSTEPTANEGVDREEPKAASMRNETKQGYSQPMQNYSSQALLSDPGEHRHDGFFLRLNLVGFGFGSASTKSDGTSVSFSGPAGLGELSIGGSVVENFALHFSINGPVMVDPELRYGSDTGTAEDTTVSSMGIGGGLSYYFMPYNIYLTFIIGTSKMQIEHENEKSETDFGISLQASLGKEWWVSSNWAMGVAGVFFFQSMKDQGINAPTWTTIAGGVLMSVTYN